MNVTLTRSPSTDQGTLGLFVMEDGTTFHSLELSWKNNEHNLSCIPAGTYTCKWVKSPKHGECYLVTGVPGRQAIEIHSANFAGDVQKGYFSQLLGCIALGLGVGLLDVPGPFHQQLAVLQSKAAIQQFEDKQAKQDFQLTIVG